MWVSGRSLYRLPLLAVYRRAWAAGHGKPPPSPRSSTPTDIDGDERVRSVQTRDAARVRAVVKVLAARRLCRTRGEWEVVEPFGAAVAMFM